VFFLMLPNQEARIDIGKRIGICQYVFGWLWMHREFVLSTRHTTRRF